MTKQIVFAIVLLITIGVFSYTISRIISYFRLTRPAFPVKNFGKRFIVMLDVAFGQTKIFRRPVIGFFHALVFWGFCVILFGSIEMIIDGLFGTDRVLKSLGIIYQVIIASGDIFGLLVAVSISIFLFRRIFLHIKRFEGIEMKRISHIDANIALSMILFLMLSLLGMNIGYCEHQIVAGQVIEGVYPVSKFIAGLFSGFSQENLFIIYQTCWWTHIVLIFIFANILPYSKHFHVFMSVPNVFLSRLDPLGKLPNMDNITKEVKLMLDPNAVFAEATVNTPIERFGIKDIEDVTWKNYFDSLACTQCGRCTSVCPANITGKMLSPRKIIMNVRERMKEKGPGLIKNGKEYTDNKSLIRNYITEEELWACTTCNACAKECPININHPTLIVDFRRYLVMEEGSAPGELKAVFSNIENNGAPWQFSPEDRMLWAKDLEMNVK
jgi:heterodisulfide reductase subunit C